jgi:siroheme decarboxylase
VHRLKGDLVMRMNNELKISRYIQRDIKKTHRPFRGIADESGMSEQEVLDVIRQMMERGLIRKFAAIVRHREAGFTANAMIVWAVPENCCEQVGQMLSSFPEISHCYERYPALEGRYNIFTMLHLRDQNIEEKVKAISKASGIPDYRILMSEEEFKKSSMEYFT